MIGDSLVGKTSIVDRICADKWANDTPATVSTAFYMLRRPDNADAAIQIWDTAGAERYRALNSVYYHNASGGILVFDLTARRSFDSLDSWLTEFTGLAQPGATVVIVGNKLDLYVKGDESCVRPEEGKRWAKQRGLMYFSTSAYLGTGLKELVNYLMTAIPQRQITYSSNSIHLDGDVSRPPAEKKSSCCS
jgi:small GTP-binding protein